MCILLVLYILCSHTNLLMAVILVTITQFTITRELKTRQNIICVRQALLMYIRNVVLTETD
jgi:hypothetical protein